MNFEATRAAAAAMDREDALARFRGEFLFPKGPDGKCAIYLCGNSLGLQPRNVRPYIEAELEDWERFGVEGHLEARHPWLPYHENVTEALARVVGARPSEVVAMNSLTVNLHLMLVSFYRPTQTRYKILMEASAFPSDQYALAAQARFHGFDPKDAIMELVPRAGEETLRAEDILATIEREGDRIALVCLGNVNYLSGQCFDLAAITRAGHARGCVVGFDLAHGVGNLELRLHDWDVDFAVWCSYKYLNSGPGAIGGAFVHERHGADPQLPKFHGWWGHDKQMRFKMGSEFVAIPGAESWQLSNPPIFQLAALRASLELFDAATMPALRKKSERLTGYLEFLLDRLPPGQLRIVTPREPSGRGCQLSLKIAEGAREKVDELARRGVIVDFREPDVVRIAPAPLYNRFEDVYACWEVLSQHG